MRRLLLVFLAACGSADVVVDTVDLDPEASSDIDLPVGSVEQGVGDTKNWGKALECKAVPDLSPLVAPQIVISIDGMTVHITDEATGYDKTFPAGVGAINVEEDEATFGESLTYYPILATKKNDFALKASTNTKCKIWWTDSETGEKSPVFAGLPFLSFYGAYAMHGPIDNYTAPNGGNLTRGYVSHGCVRMESADILEIYARLGKLAKVPVRLQREAERLDDSSKNDVKRWVGSECRSDLDCDFAGGFCHGNGVGDRGFCSARCNKTCNDRAGSPTTFCVPDPDTSSQGMCVVKVGPKNDACRPYDHLQPKTLGRFTQPAVQATVCVPGSRGWIGDKCNSDTDCVSGNTCGDDSQCTQACARACPDMTGTPWTTCMKGGQCARVCTVASNGSECAADYSCVERVRAAGDKRTVCALE